ncbi:uncharacterized protein ACMZJ9_009779 isoform 1-T3 [Mantella aurantiaca]
MQPTDEMTMAMLRMGKNRIAQICLIWVTVSLTALSRSENISRIKDLGCLNDFHKKMFCFWEVVNSNSNCTEDFELSYKNFEDIELKCRDQRNEQYGDSVVPNKCICDIALSEFVLAEKYEIKVESHGELVANTTIYIGSTIKPRAPSNVQVGFQEELHGVVQWDTGYTSTSIRNKLFFHVQIICKHDREVAIDDRVTQTKPEYHFYKTQLKRRENYVARVRAKVVEGLQGPWSEWSSEAEWKNDYSLTILDLMDIIIPVICLVMLCLTIASYFCITRCKKKWWDTIPDPKKSLIIKRKLIQKHQPIPDRRYASKKSCGKFFSRIVKAHKSKCGQLTQHGTVQHYAIDIVSSDSKKCIFVPEHEDIVRCVEMFPKEEDENNQVQEDKPEHKAEDHPFEEDLSIANMLFAILCDTPSIKVDAFENLDTESFGCSALMNSFDKEEKPNFYPIVSGHQKLGYNCYDSDDSLLDSSSSIDVVKMPCFDQRPDNGIGCIYNTPQVSFKEDCSNQSKGDPSASLGYNSFTNAVSDARKDFIFDPTNHFWLDNFSKSTVLDKSNICDQQLHPKCMLYYNRKYLCSHSTDSFQPTIKPNSRQITKQCYESKTGPTSICPVSGYQSFDQAVKGNELELGCHSSEYNSFDQAVRQGDETSVSVMNKYQSVDQAIKENELELGCDLSGYKSFDQAVRQGDETSVSVMNEYQSFDQAVNENQQELGCHISGYKSFDQAVLQGDATSLSIMNEYQSFDQAVQENCLEPECYISGYKSFDQAVQQGEDTSVCEVIRYQRFDQAVQESETSGSKNYSNSDSGYKSFESLLCQNNDYLDESGCNCENDHLKDRQCENTNFDNNREYRILSSSLMKLIYRDFRRATKETCPHFSDKPIKKPVSTNLKDNIALKHDGIPLALTFDIREHLRNMENIHRHKVLLNNSETGTIPINEAIFLCHLNKVSFTQEQLTINKNLTLQKYPATTSFFIPLYDLDSSQTTKNVLIQESSLDKDGNSYMKIK